MQPIAIATAAVILATGLLPAVAAAHAPSVDTAERSGPESALVLEDPTLSRALGATIAVPGEQDWYRMDLRAGDPLIVGMTAPIAAGEIAATFVLLGPGLPAPDPADAELVALATEAGATGALRFEPLAEPRVENHAGLGFRNYGQISMETPMDGAYHVVAFAVDPAATGKYVLAPGLREEFGPDAMDGYVALVELFLAEWPPQPEASPSAG